MPTKQRLSIRTLGRNSLVVLAMVMTAPLWVLTLLQLALTKGEGLFKTSSEILSLIPGKPGIFLRRGYYWMCLDALAVDASIGFGTLIAHPNMSIGRGVYIGARCILGKVIIEDHVTIGSNVDILSGRRQHNFEQLNEPIQQQGGLFLQIRIGRNSWIGNSSVIMADIEEDCVIGAGSVVVHLIPARSVAAGNPALVKKRREGAPVPAASKRQSDVLDKIS